MPTAPHTEIIARGLILEGSRVLVCRNLEQGYAYLPGGHVEFGEQASDALSRELLEETGLASVVGPLVLTTEGRFTTGKRSHHEINLVFHVEQLGSTAGAIAPEVVSLEPHIAFEWVDLAAVVDDDIRPVGLKAWLVSGGAVGDTAAGAAPFLTEFED